MPVAFMKAKDGQCRFPVSGDPTKPGFEVCGDQIKAGSSYCPACHARAYLPGVSYRLGPPREDAIQRMAKPSDDPVELTEVFS